MARSDKAPTKCISKPAPGTTCAGCMQVKPLRYDYAIGDWLCKGCAERAAPCALPDAGK